MPYELSQPKWRKSLQKNVQMCLYTIFASCVPVREYPGIFYTYKLQGSKIKTMADNLKYIPNDDTQNYPFCRLH